MKTDQEIERGISVSFGGNGPPVSTKPLNDIRAHQLLRDIVLAADNDRAVGAFTTLYPAFYTRAVSIIKEEARLLEKYNNNQ